MSELTQRLGRKDIPFSVTSRESSWVAARSLPQRLGALVLGDGPGITV